MTDKRSDAEIAGLADDIKGVLSMGATPSTVRARFSISKMEWDLWMATNPYFKRAVDTARAELMEELETRAHAVAMDGNAKMLVKCLETHNREEWGESKTHENHKYASTDPAEVAKAISDDLAAGLITSKEANERYTGLLARTAIIDTKKAAQISLVFPEGMSNL